MREKNQSIYQGESEPGLSREIKVELKKKMYITVPVRSKDRNDVEEITKKLVKHIEENLKYNVHRIGHFGHGMKEILGSKEKNLDEEPKKTQSHRSAEEWKEKGLQNWYNRKHV